MKYRLYADHGPGHMGHHEKLVEADELLSDESKKEMWEEWIETFHWNTQIRGGVELIGGGE